MKKIILSLTLAGIVASPLVIFAADPTQITPTVTSAVAKSQPSVTPQEKLLAKKLGQVKKKNKDTKQKIKTNITQSKAKVSKIKKDRTKTKKMRNVSKKVKTTTASSTTR